MKKPIWSKSEEISMIKDIRNKKTFDEISIKYDRSVSALELRLQKIVHDNIVAGKSFEDLSNIIGFSVDKIKQYYYEYQGFIEKKIKKKDKLNQSATIPTISSVPINKDHIKELSLMHESLPYKEMSDNIESPIIHETPIISCSLHKECTTDKENVLDKIERENKFMRAILDNIELKKKIKYYIDKNILDTKIIELVKKN